MKPFRLGYGITQQGSLLNQFGLATDSEDGNIEMIYTDSEDGSRQLITIDMEDR